MKIGKTIREAFALWKNNRQGKMDMRKIMDLMLTVMMLPIFTTLLTGMASTGDPTMDAMMTAITGILPMFFIMDAVTGMFGRGK